MNSPFKITTPAGAGLLRDPATGQLRSGRTDETPAASPVNVLKQSDTQGVDVLKAIEQLRKPDTAATPIPRAPMAAPPLPFKLG